MVIKVLTAINLFVLPEFKITRIISIRMSLCSSHRSQIPF